MATSRIQAFFSCDVEKLWDKVVSLDDYLWRGDVDRIEIVEEHKRFVEYTRDGYATTFIITAFEPYTRYEFDMENDNMKGHWAGLFSKQNDKVMVDFTEIVTVKKFYMKPFAKMYLKKQQESYVLALKKVLGE